LDKSTESAIPLSAMVTKEDWATTKETEKDDRNKHTCAISITSATGGKAAGSHSDMSMA